MTYTDGFGYSGFQGLLGDCARMAPHWTVPAGPRPPRVEPSQIHGVRVPAASVRLIAGTAQYGDQDGQKDGQGGVG
ncbi:hypothetical protein [Streptomyces sp. WAC06614]|uniref:hypothetical protein n=1 Tax=Streptomyces sp. WAC06614 TaxID=2487416 RepID=UPI000F76928A|nr:hypothetical protein [Streptomyces sp. WAC06614]RSS83466.1 hypothetical protein EF918_03730 [Streptomyces sp. WAC06614]